MIEPRSDIKERLNKVFRETFEDDSIEIFADMTAQDIPDWDSLMHTTLIVAVEREFKVRFSARDIGKLVNVGGMIELLQCHISKG